MGRGRGAMGRGRSRGKRIGDFTDGHDEMPGWTCGMTGWNEVTEFSVFVFPVQRRVPQLVIIIIMIIIIIITTTTTTTTIIIIIIIIIITTTTIIINSESKCIRNSCASEGRKKQLLKFVYHNNAFGHF